MSDAAQGDNFEEFAVAQVELDAFGTVVDEAFYNAPDYFKDNLKIASENISFGIEVAGRGYMVTRKFDITDNNFLVGAKITFRDNETGYRVAVVDDDIQFEEEEQKIGHLLSLQIPRNISDFHHVVNLFNSGYLPNMDREENKGNLTWPDDFATNINVDIKDIES